MQDEVETEQNDFNGRANWATSWQSTFFSLFCIVMIISLAVYICLLRAIASSSRTKETPTYFFMLFLFFTSLVEDALVIQQFIMLHQETFHTTSSCRMFTYAVHGNKILQALAVIAMLIYTVLLVEKRQTQVQVLAKKYFWAIVLVLLSLEFICTIWPTLNVKGGKTGQFCYFIDSSFETARRTGWFYNVLLPYVLPLLVCAIPALMLTLRMRNQTIQECEVTPVNLALVTTASYFFFHLLYYTLMLGREAEASILDQSEWRRILGLHVWYITRPMFVLIAYGWHVVVPLAPFAFDKDFFEIFPGKY